MSIYIFENIFPNIALAFSKIAVDNNVHIFYTYTMKNTINVTLSEKVFEIIREQILTGILKPGDRLLYVTVAENFQVSLSPVKEALLRLEQEGLVSITPRKGAFVNQISNQDIIEYSWIRLSLETLAMEKICEAGLPESDAARLTAINNELLESISSKNVKQCMHLDNEFHAHIVAISNIKRLIETVRKLPLVNFSVVAGDTDYVISHGDHICKTHAGLIDALARRDIETAKQLLKENIIVPLPVILAENKNA